MSKLKKQPWATAIKAEVAAQKERIDTLQTQVEHMGTQRNEALAEVRKLKQRLAEAEKDSEIVGELRESLATCRRRVANLEVVRDELQTALNLTRRELQQARSEGLHLQQRTAAAERIAQGERRWRKFYGRLAAGFAILLVAAAVAVGVSLKHDPNPRHNFEYRQ